MSEPTPTAEPVPASGSAPPPADGEAPAQSKKGAKKAEAKAKKEAEKAKKAAERAAAEAKAKASAGGDEDLAKDNYGDITHTIKVDAERVPLKKLGESHLDQTIKVKGWIQNSRMQGAKMAFIELREERYFNIQCVVAAHPDGKPVSKQMVKWIGAVPLESYVLVEATVKKPLEPVKSCHISDYELHITKLYVVAPGPKVLGMTLATAGKPINSYDDVDPVKSAEEAQAEAAAAAETDANPSASLATHLDNIVMHKRAPVQQAIADIRFTARRLFEEYLRERDFNLFEPPCLIGAASEGGANVFTVPYFDTTACLAQSPQFYKQLEIGGGRKRVYSVSPVFRAENSNTPRHMTEVRTPIS